jgi:hypothetical protein
MCPQFAPQFAQFAVFKEQRLTGREASNFLLGCVPKFPIASTPEETFDDKSEEQKTSISDNVLPPMVIPQTADVATEIIE